MMHFKTNTEEGLYVDDIDQPEDDVQYLWKNIFQRIAIPLDIIPMLIRKLNKKENTQIFKEQSKPL